VGTAEHEGVFVQSLVGLRERFSTIKSPSVEHPRLRPQILAVVRAILVYTGASFSAFCPHWIAARWDGLRADSGIHCGRSAIAWPNAPANRLCSVLRRDVAGVGGYLFVRSASVWQDGYSMKFGTEKPNHALQR
jgi:hypothetical protein